MQFAIVYIRTIGGVTSITASSLLPGPHLASHGSRVQFNVQLVVGAGRLLVEKKFAVRDIRRKPVNLSNELRQKSKNQF